MRYPSLITTLALALAALLHKADLSYAQGRVVQDQITASALQGNPLGDPPVRRLNVYLPPSYDRGGSFPTVYLLHGYSGDATTYLAATDAGLYVGLAPYMPTGGIAGVVDAMIADGRMAEMIVVMPDASNAYGGSFYSNSELCGNYEDYIWRDVVEHVDATYRTTGMRAIVGHSMGGYGAMWLAMRHPDIFSAVASHSGGLYFTLPALTQAFIAGVLAENPDAMGGPDPTKPNTSIIYAMSAAFSPNLANPPLYADLPFVYPTGDAVADAIAKYEAHDCFAQLTDYAPALATLKAVYLDAGDADEFGTQYQTDAFHQALVAYGVLHRYEAYAGDHFSGLFSHLEMSLSFLSSALTGTPSAVSFQPWGQVKAMPR